ncbi:MAG: hypothetical protein KKF41_11695 [Actinobacteria bacterium]|nr:hypothetical protein [Actinomycetota bacterium]MBU1943773.1 hypothetical protein [Actinomycetota bacterium]MBU2688238.1 hypothetical protein [Actinomycetota bacterium]
MDVREPFEQRRPGEPPSVPPFVAGRGGTSGSRGTPLERVVPPVLMRRARPEDDRTPVEPAPATGRIYLRGLADWLLAREA